MQDTSFFVVNTYVTVYDLRYKNGGLHNGNSYKIRIILLERNLTIKELAEKIGMNGNNLSNKLACDNFLKKELS